MEAHLDGRFTLGSRWDTRQRELPKNVVVLDELVLAFVDSHNELLLVVFGSCEGMVALSWNGGVPVDQCAHRSLHCFYSEAYGEDVDQQ